jgi:hypothetical protein
MNESELVEACAKEVHESWRADKLAAGITSRTSSKTGEEQLVDWDRLSDVVKDENRDMVRTVFKALAKLGKLPS